MLKVITSAGGMPLKGTVPYTGKLTANAMGHLPFSHFKALGSRSGTTMGNGQTAVVTGSRT